MYMGMVFGVLYMIGHLVVYFGTKGYDADPIIQPAFIISMLLSCKMNLNRYPADAIRQPIAAVPAFPNFLIKICIRKIPAIRCGSI